MPATAVEDFKKNFKYIDKDGERVGKTAFRRAMYGVFHNNELTEALEKIAKQLKVDLEGKETAAAIEVIDAALITATRHRVELSKVESASKVAHGERETYTGEQPNPAIAPGKFEAEVRKGLSAMFNNADNAEQAAIIELTKRIDDPRKAYEAYEAYEEHKAYETEVKPAPAPAQTRDEHPVEAPKDPTPVDAFNEAFQQYAPQARGRARSFLYCLFSNNPLTAALRRIANRLTTALSVPGVTVDTALAEITRAMEAALDARREVVYKRQFNNAPQGAQIRGRKEIHNGEAKPGEFEKYMRAGLNAMKNGTPKPTDGEIARIDALIKVTQSYENPMPYLPVQPVASIA